MAKKSQAQTYLEKIDQLLSEKGWSKAEAARQLGIDNSTLHRRIKLQKLTAEDFKKSPRENLKDLTIEQLVDELESRGWNVSLSRKDG